MATTAQILANRLNSRKSTGPRTEDGKTAVSQNAVKHGLFAESVIKGENEADYEAFHDKMLAELVPVGTVEFMMAERIASLWWRLRRADRIQNQAIDVMIARDEPSPLSKRLHNCLPKDLQEIDYDTRGDGPELVLGRSVIKDFSYSRVLDRLILYERRIENSAIKLMKELKRFQIMRRIEFEDAEQEQFEPSQSLRDEAATRPAEKKVDLKKQSQSVPGLNGAKSYLKGDYDKKVAGDADENKPNQTQFRTDMRLNEPVRGENAPALRACQ
jgi:hypothetical protein